MLAIGVGGLEVPLAIAGEPLYLRMPQVWGARLVGQLPPRVSAKAVVLEMLRRHGIDGGHRLSTRQADAVRAGGRIPLLARQQNDTSR